MNTSTLGQYLLAKYNGALLGVKDSAPVLAGTIAAMVDPLDFMLTEAIRFKFRQVRPSLEEIGLILAEYYVSIGWRIDMEDPQSGYITGNVYPIEVETCLVLMAFYEKGDTSVLSISTNPIIG